MMQRLRDALTASRYEGKSVTEIVDLLNSPSMLTLAGGRRPVQTTTAKALLLASGEWAGLRLVAEGVIEAPQQVRALALTVVDALTQLQTLGTDEPGYYAAIEHTLDGLVAAGLLSADSRSGLLGLAQAPTQRVEMEAPVARLFAGIEGAPNLVTIEMVEEALQ